MRGPEHDHDLDARFRPRGDRLERTEDHDLLGRAAAAGRTDVLGPSGVLDLQRTVGNAGVAPLLEEDRSPVHDVINSGAGSPLPADARADMEARFGGTDFADVRVHTDSAANQSAQSVNAHAYTVGPNIVFQRDKYDPSSESGKHVLAHELTHVVQQRNGPVAGTPTATGLSVSDPSDRFEREAVANADHLMSQPTAAAAAPAIQRSEDPSLQRDDAPEEEETAQTFVQREEGEEEEAAE
jgi:uncharacterized protein DUF4157